MEGSLMGSPYRVALVGTGGISRAHATACSQTDRAELVAVTDVSQESIDRFVRQFHVERMYLELDEMLATMQRATAERNAELTAKSPNNIRYSYSSHTNLHRQAWADLVGAFASHLVQRHGIEELAQWRFEVWNEMWGMSFGDGTTGKAEDSPYMALYNASHHALKAVSPRLSVGGPATAELEETMQKLAEVPTQCVELEVDVTVSIKHRPRPSSRPSWTSSSAWKRSSRAAPSAEIAAAAMTLSPVVS